MHEGVSSTDDAIKVLQEEQSIDNYIQASLAEFRTIHRVAVSNDVYIVMRQLGGYGFAVWRMTRDMTDAKQIIDGLAGCCGQMEFVSPPTAMWKSPGRAAAFASFVERRTGDGVQIIGRAMYCLCLVVGLSAGCARRVCPIPFLCGVDPDKEAGLADDATSSGRGRLRDGKSKGRNTLDD